MQKTTCQHCGNEMDVPSSYINGIIKCSACGKSFKAALQKAPAREGVIRQGEATRTQPKLGPGLYLVRLQGVERGPYTLSQLQSMWQSGVLTADAQYWQGGVDHWMPITSIMSSLHATPAQPPLPPQQIIHVKQSRSGCLLILIIALGIVVGVVLLSFF